MRIEGVTGLSAYANVTRLLQTAPGVHRANIVSADAGGIAFDVLVRGGAAGLEQALSGVARLARSSAPGATAVYRYQPQG